jgi:hypothetical protein
LLSILSSHHRRIILPSFNQQESSFSPSRKPFFDSIDPKLPFTTTLADGRVGWEAAIRSSRLNDPSAPLHLTFATPKGKPREGRGDASYQPRDGGWRNR